MLDLSVCVETTETIRGGAFFAQKYFKRATLVNH